MTRFERIAGACWLLAAVAFTGCRQDPVSEPPVVTEPANPKRSEVAAYAKEELSSISGHLPVLDEGRLEIAMPIEWRTAPRSKDYVARFHFSRNRKSPLPRITVEARDVVEGDPENLTKDNLAEYIESMVAQMDEDQLSAIDGDVEPLILEDVPCARYVTHKSFQLQERVMKADREVVLTIRDGRVYTILLDVYSGMLYKYRADAYVVLARANFPLSKAVESVETEESADESGGEGDLDDAETDE